MAVRYNKLRNVLCKESALVQAAQVLDIAAKMAIEEQDRESLVNIATIWAAVSDRLEMDQTNGGEVTEGMKQQQIGFSNGRTD